MAPSSFTDRFWHRYIRCFMPAFLFMLLWFYLWRVIDMSLFYFINGMGRFHHHLEIDREFFLQHLRFPGGLANYGMAWITALCHNAALGATAFTLIAASGYLLIIRLLRQSTSAYAQISAYLPAVAIALIASRGDYALMGLPVLSLLGGCGALVYSRTLNQPFLLRVMFAALINGLSFWFGGMAAAVTLPLILLMEFETHLRQFPATFMAHAACSALVWMTAKVIADLPFPIDPRELMTTYRASIWFFGLVPALYGLGILLPGIVRRTIKPAHHPHTELPSLSATALWVRIILSVLLAGTAALLPVRSINRQTFEAIRCLQRFCAGDWQAVLQSPGIRTTLRGAGTLAPAVNYALFRQGRLLEQMFAFPQENNRTMLFTGNFNSRNYVQAILHTEIYARLGLLNMAEKMAAELIEGIGPRPWFMRQRILIHHAKGMTNSARVELAALSHTPFTTHLHDRLLQLQNDTTGQSHHPDLQVLKENRATENSIFFTRSARELLRMQLRANPANRMAAEYLMAHFLLTRSLDSAAVMIGRSTPGGTDRLPTHCQEALLLHAHMKKTDADLLSPHPIERPIRERFTAFWKMLMQTATREQAQAQLAPSFGDTYYYYYFTGTSAGGSR